MCYRQQDTVSCGPLIDLRMPSCFVRARGFRDALLMYHDPNPWLPFTLGFELASSFATPFLYLEQPRSWFHFDAKRAIHLSAP